MLFSEPKIPHWEVDTFLVDTHIRFSALQRAENSSRDAQLRLNTRLHVSVLFSEPKIPHGR